MTLLASNRLWALCLALVLCSCAVPAPVTVHTCLPMKAYQPIEVTGVFSEMDQAASAGIQMPYTKALTVDYHQMREDNRSCLKASADK